MKKRFTKILSLALAAIAVMSLSVSSFAAGNKPAPLTPTAETTLGDVCRRFEPEWFAALPTHIQELYNETPLQQSSENAAEKARVNTVGDTILTDYLVTSVDITKVTSSSISYRGRIYPTNPIAQIDYDAMLLTVAVYDKNGDVVDSDSSYEPNTRMCTISGSFNGLKSNYKYRVEGIGVVTPPAGYVVSGPMYDSTYVTTK